MNKETINTLIFQTYKERLRLTKVYNLEFELLSDKLSSLYDMLHEQEN